MNDYMTLPKDITVAQAALDDALWDAVAKGELEVLFMQGNRPCYVDYVSKLSVGAGGEYGIGFHPEEYSLQLGYASADKPLQIIKARESFKVLKLEMASYPPMYLETMDEVQQALVDFFGDFGDWREMVDGAKLTITVASMSRKEFVELPEWEPS